MTSFKFVYEDEVRRVLIREDGGKLVYSKLINTLLNLFPSLAGKGFQLYWEDDEGDLIVCSSDAELDEAMNVMDSLKSKTLKFLVKLPKTGGGIPKPTKASSNVVHTGITCDECGLSPIVGVRYKCTVRQDFDLCETCEAKQVQPHAMIKIVDPSQAPSVLVYGLQDGPQQDRWQRGFHNRHHGHHPFPSPQGHPFPPPPFGHGPPHGPPPHHPHFRGENNCRRKCDRWAKKWEKFADIAKESPLAPFVSAMDAVFNGGEPEKQENSVPTERSAKPSEPVNEETVTIEDELIEKAILESLMINEDKPEGEKVEKPKPVHHVETARPAVPTLPKPALRFVKDVTFSDGTVVQPGALFKKAWRVRNDGSHPWPEGSVLVSVGGDVMSNQDYKEPLPVLKPEEETEIALQLNAPHLPGMYTSYFRAQTKDQQYFGQRLWASVVVADQESDWQVVTEDKLKAEAALKASEPVAPSAPVNPPASAPAPEPAVKAEEAPVVPAVEEKKEEAVEVPPVPASLKSAIILWRRELAVLNDMGFSDPVLLVPLLQQHLGSPLSLSADKNAVPSVEGMQQVIATLLQMN